MEIMTLHNFFDKDVEKLLMNTPEKIEIVLKESSNSLLLNKSDVAALAKEFNMTVYDKTKIKQSTREINIDTEKLTQSIGAMIDAKVSALIKKTLEPECTEYIESCNRSYFIHEKILKQQLYLISKRA